LFLFKSEVKIRLGAVKHVVNLIYISDVFVVDDKNIVHISKISFYSGFMQDIVDFGIFQEL